MFQHISEPRCRAILRRGFVFFARIVAFCSVVIVKQPSSDNTPYEKIGDEVYPLDTPFDIPESWEWVRLAKARLEQVRTTKAAQEAQAEAIGAFMFEVQELDALTEFDEKLWLTIIDTVTIHADGRMTFKFRGGKTLTSY